jgi:hypothetical protein
LTKPRRLLFLGLLLALTLSAAAWVSEAPEDSSQVVAAVPRKKPVIELPDKNSDKSQGLQVVALLDKLQRAPMAVSDLNPFGAKSWFVPPPRPPEPPPPKPTAPPLPFTYVGKLEEDGGQWIVYLAKGAQSYVVKQGETFDHVYRLDGIENGNLVIQYLPVPTKQLLPIAIVS